MQTHIITGGAGFIAANLARALLEDGARVVAVDDLSRGTLETIAPLRSYERFAFHQLDCTNLEGLIHVLRDYADERTEVWHLAANSDIPAGVANPRIDLERTFLTTFEVLQMMKHLGLQTLHFASSSAIYGDFGDVLIHEDIGPLAPISNYGAMKLASEAQIRAAVEAFLPRANVFRFPNVIGVPATHGVIWDFMRKLRVTPERLEVLGDGSQQKAYLHVDDLVSAMRHIADAPGRHEVVNIGPADDGVTVRFIAETVKQRVSPEAQVVYGEGNRGWVGDVPRFRYSVDRLLNSGWRPSMSSSQSVVRAVDEIATQLGFD